MTRLHKKCLIASTSMHGLLVLLLVFGSAFFVAKEKIQSTPKINVVPTRWVEAALAGGGGNPNLPITDDKVKGQTLAPVPQAATPPAPKTQPPKQVQSEPAPPPPPKPEVRRPEKRKPEPKEEAFEPEPAPSRKIKPVDIAKPKVSDKPVEKPAPQKHKIDLTELKPIVRSDADKTKAKEEEEARERARADRESTRQLNLTRQRIAQQLGRTAEALTRGFQSGTKVEVGGPGGEAYANYGALVQAAYEDAWRLLPDVDDDDAITVVRVTISRTGRVSQSEIVRRSGKTLMDRSVQKALDKVKGQGLPPFPEFIREAELTFTIEFNLRTKRLMG